MKHFALILFALILILAGTSAKVFTVCSLVRTLRSLGVPKNEMADWVCIAKYESSFNSKTVGPKNKNGSRDYGLFQINNKYWCQGDIKSTNYCKVSCNSLLSDNISQSLKCARLIKSKQGWGAWVAWKNKCQKNKPNVNNC